MFVDTKVLSQARGSCYVEIGSTKLMAAVFGPRQSDRKFVFSETGRLQCDVRYASFAAGGGAKQEQTVVERAMAAAITQALEPAVQLDKFPKAVVEVVIFVMEAGGGELAAAITAASMALADAGVEMHDLVAACSVARCGNQLLLDPTSPEATSADASALVALMPAHTKVTQLSLTGTWDGATGQGEGQGASWRHALELAMGGCVQLNATMREVLLEKAAALVQA